MWFTERTSTAVIQWTREGSRTKSYSDELTLSKWVDGVNVNMTDTKPMTNNNPADEARQLEFL